MNFDVTITARDVQELSNGDAVTAFFARLGWRTDIRIEQSPGNLGITAEGTVKPIKKIELIADQDGALQVYVFELTSVTIANTRAIVRAFRERAGNYLFVFTSAYDRLDFILVEKYLPSRPAGRGIGAPSVGVRPRILSVDRRKPTTVDLRVLRRFSYTESDPYSQYDKLLSAYSIADWSEEHFNNRALFSDYYLTERLPSLTEWQEDPKPTYVSLSKIYQGASTRLANKTVETLQADLFEPAVRTLGFHLKKNQHRKPGDAEPSYRLFSNGDKQQPIATALVYPWGRYPDGKDYSRDADTADENPGAVVVSILERGEASWAIVTNGRIWRLYSAKAHSRATNYYEIDVEELLSQDMSESFDPATAFRYFWLLFRRQSFVGQAQCREGREVVASFLDQLLNDSEDYAKELGNRLKERVFEDIFPHISEGFISFIRKRDGVQADLSQEALDEVFQGTLALLYRILFLLYAEARDLLPVKEVRGYYEVSLKKIKEEVADIAGKIVDEAGQKLKKGSRDDEYGLYERLTTLFKVLDSGDAALNVPFYNGGLFLSNPEEEDETPEAVNARFLNSTKLADRYLARAIDRLARDVDTKTQALAFIDYKSLGVRQLGSIYEGLLEFKLRIAPEKMAIVKGKKTEEIVPYREAAKEKRRILTIGRGRSAEERVWPKGKVYLENDKRERKATGSYYTPDHIVKYIVENAVGPVLKEKFEALRPKLRKAQADRKAFFDKQKAFVKSGMKPEPESKADLIGQGLVDELFDVRVLDPAMGSGHFLVEAVDFITDKALDFLNAFPWNPVSAHLEKMRKDIMKEMENLGVTIDAARLSDVNLLKRHVLKRCIYGVDLNPMAVELAKVSLWLDCFTLGAPLSFLDHHIKCGNSLIGVTVDEVREAVEGGQEVLWGSQFTHLKLAAESMREVGDLSDLTSEQVKQSRKKFCEACDLLAPYKRILDVYTSQWFGNKPVKSKKGKQGTIRNPAIDFLKSDQAREFVESNRDPASNGFSKDVVSIGVSASKRMRFFHWELEFPEVFLERGMRKPEAGFDSVIGNPPYDVLAEKELGYDVSIQLTYFKDQDFFGPAVRGKSNLYKFFVCRGMQLMSSSGSFSFIVPMALLGDDQAAGVRRTLLERTSLCRVDAFPQKDDPRNRVFPEAKLSTTIFVTRSIAEGKKFLVRANPGRFVVESSPTLLVSSAEIFSFDEAGAVIPSCAQHDWDIIVRILGLPAIKRLGAIAKSFQGEVNETNERKRGSVTSDPTGQLTIRGANICMYAVRDASQGEPVYLDVEEFLYGKRDSSKAFDYLQERVGFQRSSPQNNFRRIIAARIPKGNFCLDTISYVTESSCKINLDLVLALLNSALLDWYFRIVSTNSKVNEYQFDLLPVPTFPPGKKTLEIEHFFKNRHWGGLAQYLREQLGESGVLPEAVAGAVIKMTRRIQDIEAERVLTNRSERSNLSPESQPIQDAIDEVLFKCYGLSDEDAEYVKRRLKEML